MIFLVIEARYSVWLWVPRLPRTGLSRLFFSRCLAIASPPSPRDGVLTIHLPHFQPPISHIRFARDASGAAVVGLFGWKTEPRHLLHRRPRYSQFLRKLSSAVLPRIGGVHSTHPLSFVTLLHTKFYPSSLDTTHHHPGVSFFIFTAASVLSSELLQVCEDLAGVFGGFCMNETFNIYACWCSSGSVIFSNTSVKS